MTYKKKFFKTLGFIGMISLVFTGLLTGLAVRLNAAESVSPSVETKVRLEALIQSAQEKNPSILTAKAQWLAAKKRIWVDGSLPDPMAEYALMGPMKETRVGPEKKRFGFSQEIPFPAKLWEKGKIAKHEAAAAWARYRAIKRDITLRLTKAYSDLYFSDESIRVIDEIKGILKKFETVAEARYSNVSGSQRDVAKAQAEVSMSLERLYSLKQEKESASAMINALLDRDPMLEIGSVEAPAKPELKLTLVELVNLAVTKREEIKEAEAIVAKSTHLKRLSRLAYIPDLNVGFEYTQIGNGTTTEAMDGRDSWMVPLKINLPIWQNRIIPEIQEAGQIYKASEAKLLEAKNTTFFEVKDAYWRYDTAMKIALLYETAVVPQAKIAMSADQASYESAKGNFLELLDSERIYLNAKLSQLRFFTEALKAHADLVRATGLDLKPIGNEGGEKS